LGRLGVMGLGELFRFPVMAPHAILRRDQRRDEKPLVIVPVRFAFFGPMTPMPFGA
jgi:hypothetical protein